MRYLCVLDTLPICDMVTVDDSSVIVISADISDWQGYGKPSGLEGKSSKGRGQDRHLATLEKPLPLTRVSRV